MFLKRTIASEANQAILLECLLDVISSHVFEHWCLYAFVNLVRHKILLESILWLLVLTCFHVSASGQGPHLLISLLSFSHRVKFKLISWGIAIPNKQRLDPGLPAVRRGHKWKHFHSFLSLAILKSCVDLVSRGWQLNLTSKGLSVHFSSKDLRFYRCETVLRNFTSFRRASQFINHTL